jgi:hypothetical protein
VQKEDSWLLAFDIEAQRWSLNLLWEVEFLIPERTIVPRLTTREQGYERVDS